MGAIHFPHARHVAALATRNPPRGYIRRTAARTAACTALRPAADTADATSLLSGIRIRPPNPVERRLRQAPVRRARWPAILHGAPRVPRLHLAGILTLEGTRAERDRVPLPEHVPRLQSLRLIQSALDQVERRPLKPVERAPTESSRQPADQPTNRRRLDCYSRPRVSAGRFTA